MKTIIFTLVFLCQVALCYSQSNNLVLNQPYVRFAGTGFYSMIPKDLLTDLKLFYADVINNGTATQTNVSLNVKISNSVSTLFDETGLAVSAIAPDSSQIIYLDSLGLLTFTAPSTYDNYTINYSVNQSETDEVPSDNYTSLSFLVNDSVYARDIENNTSIILNQLGGVDGDFIGTSYYFPADKEVNSMSVFIDYNTTIGTLIIGKIISGIGTGSVIEQIYTNDYIITANDLGKWITIPFIKDGSSEFIAQGQMVYVGVECYSFSSGDVNIGADSSAIHDFANESIIRINNVFQSIDKVPLVRINIVNSYCACSCYFSSRTNVSCNGGNDGSATVAYYGLPPNSFLWSNGETSQTATNLSSGIYSVSVTDILANEVSCSVTISEPNYLSSYISTEGNMMQANANGGTPPYSYFWFSGDTTQLIPITDFGCNCAITIFDANNCYTSICPSCYDEMLNSIELQFFLNPNTKNIYIENAEGYNIEIYNITGAKLLETKCTEQSSAIDVSAFVNGTYIVKAYKDNSFVYKKVCIVR